MYSVIHTHPHPISFKTFNVYIHTHTSTFHIHVSFSLLRLACPCPTWFDASTFSRSLQPRSTSTNPAPSILPDLPCESTYTTPDNRNALSRYSCDLMWVSTLPLYLFGQLPRCQRTTSRTFNIGSVSPGALQANVHNTTTQLHSHHTTTLNCYSFGSLGIVVEF